MMSPFCFSMIILQTSLLEGLYLHSRMTLLVLPAPIAIHVVMMITAKNGVIKIMTGATMIANAIIMIGQRDRGLHSHVTADRKTSSTT